MKLGSGRIAVALVPVMALAIGLAGCGQESKPSAGGAKPGGAQAPATEQPKVPLVPKAQLADWCGEHGVPESICTRCNQALIADFKKKGDWCDKHNLPGSQCITCHPELDAKLKALAPKPPESK